MNALDTMRDENDHILIEGFYDDVAPLNEMDEFYTDRMAEVFDEDMYLNKRLYTSRFLHDKRGRDAQHALLWEPTLNIDGIWAAIQGLQQRPSCHIMQRARSMCAWFPI